MGASLQTNKCVATLENVFQEDLSDEVIIEHTLGELKESTMWEEHFRKEPHQKGPEVSKLLERWGECEQIRAER